MKIYTIVGGVNGSGKSSLIGSQKKRCADFGQIIDVDTLNVQCGGIIAGGKAAIALQEQYMADGISFTQETTLAGKRPVQMAKAARAAGYYVRLFYVGINTVEDALQRIEQRVKNGGHDIPKDDVLRRFNMRIESLISILKYCDEAIFYDNQNGFVSVGEYRNGEIIPEGNYRPIWFADLQNVYQYERITPQNKRYEPER